MKQAINTRTQEEYDALMRYYDGKKIQWYIDRKASSENYWPEYGEGMCISFGIYTPEYINYADVSFYKKLSYEIIPFTEFAKANTVEEPDWKALYLEGRELWGGYVETLKAALKGAIEMQEQELREEFYAGQEEAFKYSIEMLEKHLTKHKDDTN